MLRSLRVLPPAAAPAALGPRDLVIEASAFGGGTHPTTASCLAILEDAPRPGAPRRPRTGLLVTVGTAICGGSAIAAAAPVLGAEERELSVSLATVFVLNAVALVVFPPVGHAAGLSEPAFGLWAALAIHAAAGTTSLRRSAVRSRTAASDPLPRRARPGATRGPRRARRGAAAAAKAGAKAAGVAARTEAVERTEAASAARAAAEEAAASGRRSARNRA